MLRYFPLGYLLSSGLLSSCQPEQKYPTRTSLLPAPPSSVNPRRPAGTATAVALAPVAPARGTPSQTLYPDTLQPRALAYQVRTTAQVDTMPGKWLRVADTRFRVLDVHATPAYGDGPYLHFFCRAPGAPTRWLELDLQQPLNEFLTDLYVEPQTVELDQRAPAEVLLRLGGRNDGNASGTGVGYTLLLSLAGQPRVIWQSLDSWQETIRPLLTEADTTDSQESSFTRGYREDAVHRRVTVRAGAVQVPHISHSPADSLSEAHLTPITPGRYQYQQGHFQRMKTKSR
jgi:hypothetical protein